jgi:co-chaperonin GroES (HSP10)
MPKVDPTWGQYEKKMHSEDPKEAVKATEAFDAERDFQTKKSETVRKWEEDRKKDMMAQKPDMRRRAMKEQANAETNAFKKILDLGSIHGGIRPAPGYIIVEPDDILTETPSGIILPDRENERQNIGTVMAVGQRVPIPSSRSRFFEPPVSAGERVLYKRMAGADIEINSRTCKLMLFSDVLCTIENENND